MPPVVRRLSQPSDLDPLLLRTTWGTDGLRYRVHDVDWGRIPADCDPLVFGAFVGDDLAGGGVVLPRPWGAIGGLLAVDDRFQGQGLGRALLGEALALELPVCAVVEAANARSLKLGARVGARHRATLVARTVTRARPRLRTGVRRLAEAELPLMIDAVQRQGLAGFDAALVRPSEVWTTDDCAAGLQIVPHRWTIERIGLPRGLDPLVRRLLPLAGIRPHQHDFGVVHHWWGTPHLWPQVLEHAMAALGLRAVTLVGDTAGRPWRELASVCRRGVLGTIVGDQRLEVLTNRACVGPMHFTPLHGL